MKIPSSNGKSGSLLSRAALAFPIAFYSLISLILIVLTFVSALKSDADFYANPIGLPSRWIFANFEKAWVNANFSLYFKNSIIITALSLVFILIVSSMAAYAIARFKYKLGGMAYIYFMLGFMFPLQLYVLPMFLLERSLGLLNSYAGLIVTYTATAQSFSIFLMVGFFRTLPVELEEAGRLDGASDFKIFRSVMMPLSAPILTTVAILNLVGIWNDFFLPLVFIQSNELRTVPLGLISFYGQYNSNYPMLFAALAISIVPIAVAYMLSAKTFVKGMVSGAIK
ncbi:carbohydrate ABC transporter permease [Cohnella nanjingensis]|uniref:Carbohydrate ABC transporter permease n=1 Tax=Cohnella nanjingensis TaxID=1387779 RepID=A0A7X0RRF1_9BACL|nr:carbohydrate ABC transporter permease [Cohnella nanjingensis]MBB6672257.1 carbohydrate ABC transporter permease [Cohnella nanjingensis]